MEANAVKGQQVWWRGGKSYLYGELDPIERMRFVMMTLCLSYWMGVAGQELPFTIEVEDLNLGSTENRNTSFALGDEVYLLSSDNCIYSYTATSALDPIDCESNFARSFVPTTNGIAFRVSYDAPLDRYRVGYVERGRYTTIFETSSPIHRVYGASDRIVFGMDSKVWSLSSMGGSPEELIDLTANEITGFVAETVEDLLLVRTGAALYLTDGTKLGTVKLTNRSLIPLWVTRSATHVYFREGGRGLWQYRIGDNAAKLVLEEDNMRWVYATDHGAVVAVASSISDGSEAIYTVSPEGAARRLRLGLGGDAITGSSYSDLFAAHGRVLFRGSTQMPGVFVTDGTDAGTYRVLEEDYGYAEGRGVTGDALTEDMVVLAAGYRSSDNYQLYYLDLSTRQLTPVGTVGSGIEIHPLVETTEAYIFEISNRSYRLDKLTRSLTYLGNLDAAYRKRAKDSETSFLIRYRNWETDGIIAIKHEDYSTQAYALESATGERLTVVNILSAGDRAYATAEDADGNLYLFRLGYTEEEVAQVAMLSLPTRHSDIAALHSGGGELLISADNNFYTYRDGSATTVSDWTGGQLTDYIGKVDGQHAFSHSNIFMIPALNVATSGFYEYTQSKDARYSAYHLVNGKAYLLKYSRFGFPTNKLALYAADASSGLQPAVVLSYPFEARDEPFHLRLSSIGDVLYYAIPGATQNDMRSTWHYYHTLDNTEGMVEGLTGIAYRGGRTAVLADSLYFRGSREGGVPSLFRYVHQSGEVQDIAVLREEEELVQVLESSFGLLAVTDYRIINLVDGSTYLEVPEEDQQFEQVHLLGQKLFLEISRPTSLGFYSYGPTDRRILPLSVGYDFRNSSEREAGHSAVIGSNVLFRGAKGNRYAFGLYNGDRQTIYQLGTLPREITSWLRGPLTTAHQGEFYYLMQDPALGLELHHFRPPYAHTLSGRVFDDRNANGRFDGDDLPLAGRRVTASGGSGLSTYTDSLGHYTLYLSGETDYTVSVPATNCNDASAAYSFTTGSEEQTGTTHDFALIGRYATATLIPHLASGPARCSFTVPFWLTVTNDGCQPQDGGVTLELHDEVVLVAASSDPMVLNDGSRTLHWNLPTLAPGGQYQIKLQLKMPDEDLAGQEISLPVTTSFAAADGTEVVDTFTYDDVLRCAIDPNDKRSFPRRAEPTDAGYVQFDETITYMIRFQNTGNDTAFTVRLEDQLSDSLDYTTFQPLTSSHDYEVTLTAEGMLEVLYRNILLVDSTTNEPGSHGFFTFSIEAKEGLEDFDEITNRAGIFFDFNRPVITNRAKNTFVEALDADGDGYMFFADCDDTNAAVNPGMADIPNNGIDEDCDGADLTTSVADFNSRVLRLAPNPTASRIHLELADAGTYGYALYNAQGQRVSTGSFRGRQATVSLEQLSSGVYLLRLTDASGGAVTRRVVRY